MTNHIAIVYAKEMRDMVRDRRALLAAFSFAFLGPFFIFVIMMATAEDSGVYNKPEVAVAGAEYAPGLVTHLANNDFAIREVGAPDEVPAALPEGTNGLIVIPADFQEKLATGDAAEVVFYVAETSTSKIRRSRQLSGLLRSYSSRVVQARLQSRGVPVGLMAPISVSTRDIAEESFQRQFLSDGLVLILILAPFVASMSVAIDTLAGERERHSFQSLLAQPVSGQSLVVGKWMMVTTFAVVGTLLACGTYFLALELVPADRLPLSMHISPANFVLTLVQMVPLAMLVASLQLYVSIRVKSFKEGQTYMSMLMMAPMFIGYIKAYGSDKLPEAANYFPVLSHMEGMGELLFSNNFVLLPFLASVGTSFVGFALFLYLTARQVDDERLLDEV